MIKSLDINYGFNGEVSTASVIYTDSDIACQAKSIQSSDFSVDDILKDFSLYRKTKSNNAGFRETSEEWVDKGAQRLESIAVLVRGITAAQFETPYSFYGRIYDFAEVDPEIVEIGKRSETKPILQDNNVLILGRAVSVVAATYKNDTYYKFYSEGKEIGRTPRGSFPEEVNDLFDNLDIDASIKHGYTIKDFEDALKICGYELKNFPSDTRTDFILIETGGSLKDCISSVASVKGLYWTCRNKTITFYDRPQIESISSSIIDETDSTDETIISTNYSEDLYKKSKIAVIKGQASEDFSNVGGSSSIGAVNRSVLFKYIDLRYYLKAEALVPISPFYSTILFSDIPKFFDYMFLLYVFTKTDKAQKYFPIQKYIDESKIKIADNDQPFKFSNTDSKIKKALEKISPNDKTYYDMRTTDDDGSCIPLPSDSKIYQAIKSVCQFFKNTLISRPVSKFQSERYQITPEESYNVSKPYKSDTKVIEVEELAVFVSALQSLVEEQLLGGLQNLTLWELSQKIHLLQGQGFTIEQENSYIYIAKKNLSETNSEFFNAKTAIDNLTKKGLPTLTVETDVLKLLPSSKDRNNLLSNIVDTSTALYTQIATKADVQVKMKAIKVRDPEADDSSSNDAEEERKRRQELLNSNEIKSFNVSLYMGGELSTVEISTFDCNLDEEAFIKANLEKLNPSSDPQKTSSVTYFGYKAPPENDPSVSSYVLNFSDSSVSTTITKSTREILGIDQNILMSSYSTSNSKNIGKQLRARQKNALGIR
jgi:hypothetical protein